jgi:hypothetical protein
VLNILPGSHEYGPGGQKEDGANRPSKLGDHISLSENLGWITVRRQSKEHKAVQLSKVCDDSIWQKRTSRRMSIQRPRVGTKNS